MKEARRTHNVLGRWARLLGLGCALALGGSVVLAPPMVTQAQARRRRHRHHRRHRPRHRSHRQNIKSFRSMKQGGALAPRKDVKLDTQIEKTKSLKTNVDKSKRPTLTLEQLEQNKNEKLLDEKLDEEIKLAHDLLQFESKCEDQSKVRFRLANLYWEKSKRAFFRANDFNTPASARARYNDLMNKLQARSVEYYKKIVNDCPGYSDLAKVLNYLGRSLLEMGHPDDGVQYFKRVIQGFPDSKWVPHSWFEVGEYFFNTKNDARKALKAYQKAASYPNSQIYGFAIYKEGWCYVNTADWDLAMQKFDQVIHISDDPAQALDSRGRLSLRKEALKDYVRAYSHLGAAKDAYATFMKVGGVHAVQHMMEILGNWYVNRDDHTDCIIVYRDLIRHYPRSTRLAIYQGRIVDAASRLGDDRATIAQAKLLTKYFKRIRHRVQVGDLNADDKTHIDKDMRQAKEIAENTLRRLALNYHKEAKKLRGKAQDRTYQNAYELYKQYLAVFPKPDPKADVNYVFFMRFYYAEVLYHLEKFREAAQNYDMVVDMNPHPKDKRQKAIVLDAAEESVRSWHELVDDLDRKSPPEISGTKPKPIPPVKQSLIHACQRYIKYVGNAGDKIVEIRYWMARINYEYNHLDQAAPIFLEIVKDYPANSVACYAANLALDIYNGEKNYRALRDSTRAYLASSQLACTDDDRAKFKKIEEQASFFMIKGELEDKQKYVQAGNAYMQFYKDYPTSQYADDAVYNAAVNYDKGNRLDKANEVRRFLVKTFPDSPLVPETLYNIAESYERIVDFKNAADYLEQFAAKYPKDKRSKNAIYNAGLYRATLQDFDGARVDRQKYIQKYPDDPDLYKVAFSNCQSFEDEARSMETAAKQSHHNNDKAIRKTWESAHDCYLSWLKNSSYTRDHPDMVCEAQFRRGEIMLNKTDYAKGYLEQKKYLYKNWPTWKKHGVDKVPQCAAAIAELKFRDLRNDFHKYTAMRISQLNPTKKGKKHFDASVAAKVKSRDRLVSAYKDIAKIGVAKWSLAALYSIGELYRDSIDKLLHAPIPNKIPGYKLSADDKKMLRQQLAKMAKPVEEKAVEAYRVCVNKANQLGVYNKWSVKALDQLQKLRPDEYPLVVERIPPVKFAADLVVAENGVVIRDGDTYKGLEQKLKAGVGPPGSQPAKKAVAATAQKASKAPTPAPAARAKGHNRSRKRRGHRRRR